MKKVLPFLKLILTLLPLLQRRVLLNVLTVWKRVILPPNKTMVVLGNGDITNASSSSSSSSSSESKSECDVQPLESDLLMVRRSRGSVCMYICMYEHEKYITIMNVRSCLIYK